MSNGKEINRGKRMRVFVAALLVLVIAGASIGGVAAYLSGTSQPVTNDLKTANEPALGVNADNSIVVNHYYFGYAVFLRAAVVVNWENTETHSLVAEVPVEGTDYSLTVDGTQWFRHTDGFYYYKGIIQENKVTAPVVKITPLRERDGYQLTVKVVAQTIQAVGETDVGGKDPVEVEWGIDRDTILNGT